MIPDGSGGEEPVGKPDGRAPVASFYRLKTANEYALVVLSMKLPYWLEQEEGRYVLYVPAEYEDAVRDQLGRFQRESRYWPPVEHVDPLPSASAMSLWIYGGVLAGFFYLTHGRGAAGEAWQAAGRVDAERILDAGEWHRCATALTLHADIGHLAGNLAGGALFGYFLVRALGGGLGWLLILLAGILGNAVNVMAHASGGHLSVGASTAVFGALGAVVGYSSVREYRAHGLRMPRRLWIPLAAGVVLLGFLGAGGERTDVLAHLWGFVAGLALAVPLAWPRQPWRPSAPAQAGLGLLALLLLAAAWATALAGG